MNRKKFLACSIGTALSLGLLTVPMMALTQKIPIASTVEAESNAEINNERVVVIAGTIQTQAGAARNWDPSDMKTRMDYIGNGFYTYTVDLPAGAYYYKVAINGSWAENYGLDGNFDGANVQLNLTKTEKVTFYYNDITHKIKDSTTYKLLDESELPKLSGNFGNGNKVMYDLVLDQFYQTDVELKAGSYEVIVNQKGEKPLKQTIDIVQDGKVMFYYDSSTKHLIADDGKIHEDKIYHDTWDNDYRLPFEAVKVGSPVKLSIAVQHGDVQNAKLILIKAEITAKGGDEYNPDFSESKPEIYDMNLSQTKDGKDFWTVTVKPQTNGIYGYKFLLNDVKEYGDDAKAGNTGEVKLRGVKPFQLTVYSADYHTPDWAKEAVVYQIFPDRFFNGDKNNDNARQTARGNQPIQHRSWNELPANYSKSPAQDGDNWECNDFFGGDLAGITRKLDYLKDLGITAIYVNPIMNACSNHRYDAVDYGNLDPLLGDMQSFKTLVSEMSKRNMRLIMDGVFNHVGDDSIYFDRYGKYKWVGAYEYWSRVYDLMNDKQISKGEAKIEARKQLLAEGQEFSPYHWEDWFEIYNDKSGDDMGEKYSYHDWQGFSSLVPFNDLDYPVGKDKVVSTLGKYLLYDEDAVITKWFKEGLSGWRFDVAKEIPSSFWVNVRKEVKKLKTFDDKEPLLLGEIWQDGSHFLTGDQFDSVMNYKLSAAIGDIFLIQGDAKAADEELKILRQNYPREALYDLMNIIDSHDTVRAIYKFGGGKENAAQAALQDFDYQLGKARLKLAVVFLMGYPGMPTIYYGDEAGVYGSADPDCRRTYPWGNEDKELIDYYRKVISVRNNNKKLFAHGNVDTLKAEGDIYAFSRTNGKEAAVIILNRGQAQQITLDTPFAENTKFIDQLSDYSTTISNGKLTINVGENQALMLLKS